MTIKRESSDILGVMSGSSMDGLDLAFIRLSTEIGNSGLLSANYELLYGATIPIPEELLNQLKQSSKVDALSLLTLDQDFGSWAGKAIDTSIKQTSFSPTLIGFHGHTVFHFPDRKVSLQLGHGAALSVHAQLPVVTDFRSQDLALGGQGAPMVSIAEKWLWPGYAGFLNLGGICNITLKNSEEVYESADIWVCNQILNHLAREVGHPYDDQGLMAANGQPIDELIEALLLGEWFNKKAPKSMDNSYLTEKVIPAFNKYSDYPASDKLHSAVVVIAKAIANQVNAVYHTDLLPGGIMVTGGGTLNNFLVEKIRAEVTCDIILPDLETIHFKEAIMVAFAGWLRWKGLPNFIKEATGAKTDAIGGVLHMPALPDLDQDKLLK